MDFPTSNRKDIKAKPGHKNRANQKHASGVWDKYSPTGVELGEKFCKENFDHSNGKPWATILFNPNIHKVTKKLRDGEWYPSTTDRPCCYERFSRSIVYVPRVAPFRSDIVHMNPNERMFPTEHKADSGRFARSTPPPLAEAPLHRDRAMLAGAASEH